MQREAPGRQASRAAYVAYRSGAMLATTLPAAVAAPLARSAARALWAAFPERRSVVARHLRRVHGPALTGTALRREVRAVFESYARYWLEAFRLSGETPDSIRARMHAEGMEHLEAAFAAGRGVVLALPHLGGWDFGGAWLALLGYRPLAVAEVIEPPELFEWFVSWRRRLGVEIVPATDSAGTTVLKALRQGRLLGLVADRDILGTGIEVEFFGETTRLPAGPAVLALRTGAPLLAGAVYFEGRNGHRAVIRPPLQVAREGPSGLTERGTQGRFRDEVLRITQALARELEELISAAPHQWHLMQPNWPSDPGWQQEPAGAGKDAG